MDLKKAAEIVTADQNQNDWGDEGPMSETEAVAHVRNTMRYEDLIDYGDENTEAYRQILSSRERL